MVAGVEAGRHAAEVAVMLPEGGTEETVFGEAVATTEHREKEKGVLERNLGGINFLLILLGILCTTFMVYQGGAMLGPGAAAPTLGLIVCLYSVVTGIAYFIRKLSPLKTSSKLNAAGYPVPRCFTGRHLFGAINFTFGTSTLLAMALVDPPHPRWPLPKILGLCLGTGLLLLGLYPAIRLLTARGRLYRSMTLLQDSK